MRRPLVLAAGVLVLAGCSSAPVSGGMSSSERSSPGASSPAATADTGLVSSRLAVPAGLDAEPFDVPRAVLSA